jgi:4-hydroxy 2-oxovalerate aldolase
MGVPNAIDIDQLTAVAQDDVGRTFHDSLPVIDRTALIQGRFGAYNSFFLHANRAAERYGVPAHEILKRVGERGYVGGQEVMIIDVAGDAL